MIQLTFGSAGETRQCFYCKAPYKSGKVEHRILENRGHTCPQCATRYGYSVDTDIKPPAGIQDRKQLSDWLTDTLEIDHNSKTFRDLYAEHAGYLPEYNFLKSEDLGRSKKDIELSIENKRKAEAAAQERERIAKIEAVDAKFKSSIEALEERLRILREESGDLSDDDDTPGPVILNCKPDGSGRQVCRSHKG